MNIKQTAALLVVTVFTAFTALADETLPTLPMSKAAKLAEDAITSASLPADHFIRSITLIQSAEAPAYYRALYKPPLILRVQVGIEPPPPTVDFIRVAMDGRVSFEQQELHPRRTIQSK
jgi:hypothetical protein